MEIQEKKDQSLQILDLKIEVLQKKVEFVAAAGGSCSSSCSCSNISLLDIFE